MYKFNIFSNFIPNDEVIHFENNKYNLNILMNEFKPYTSKKYSIQNLKGGDNTNINNNYLINQEKLLLTNKIKMKNNYNEKYIIDKVYMISMMKILILKLIYPFIHI